MFSATLTVRTGGPGEPRGASTGEVWICYVVGSRGVLAPVRPGGEQHRGWENDKVTVRAAAVRAVVCIGLIAFSGYAIASAQELSRVRVQILSDQGGIAGARVSVDGAGAATDSSGLAVLTVIPGLLEITVVANGYLPATESVTIPGSGDRTVEIRLERLEEQITVYATRTGVRLEDSPVRVETLDREEIEEKMMMTPGDIVMMLNEMGGLRVQTTSPGLGAASVRIQGMKGRHTQFLSDGLPLFGQQGGGLGLLQVPPADLGQVEVIKGVSSALYGAGAMAGVVNLISRRPAKKPVHEFLLNRTSAGGTNTSVFLASHFTEQWSGSLLSSGDWQQRRDVDRDGWADLAGYARGVVRPRAYWDGGEGRTALITVGLTYESRAGGSRSYVESLETRRLDFGGNVQWLLDGKLLLMVRGALSSQHHDHGFGEVRERDEHALALGEVSVRGTYRRNVWVGGVVAERERYRPADVPRFAYQFTTPGLFLQDDLAVASWLSVSASARADFHSAYGVFLSPRISALLRWKGWMSRLSAGQGFFAPTPLTEETEAAGLMRLAIPKPLVAERGRSTSVDVTRSSGPLTYSATWFGSVVRNPIHVTRDSAYLLTNLAAPARNNGVEILATLRAVSGKSSFPMTASYTFVSSRETESGITRPTPLTPLQSFGVSGMWEREAGRIGLEGYYIGVQQLEGNSYRPQSRPYWLFGFFAERRVGPVRLFVNAENLADVRQTRWDPLLRGVPAADGRQTVDAWAPLDGRVVNGGVRWKF